VYASHEPLRVVKIINNLCTRAWHVRAGRQDRVVSAEEIHTTVRSDGVWLFIIIQRSPGTSALRTWLLTNTTVQAVNEALYTWGHPSRPTTCTLPIRRVFFNLLTYLFSTVDRATPNATPLTDPCTDPHC
jgi:hypothetical protein